MKIKVRGYAGRRLLFEEELDTRMYDIDAIAQGQIERVASHRRHMIEIEFVDAPSDDPNRFFRFGSDPAGMLEPIAIDLSDGESA